jgi:serine/threonine-protein kinase
MDPWSGAEVGAYRLGMLIGRGPVGAVYRALDQDTGQRVALKIIEEERAGGPKAVGLLVAAARAAAELRHPNILPVIEAGLDEEVGFVAMPHVESGDLRALMRWEGALDPARVLDLLEEAAQTLDAAHGRRLVHGNLKPSNLLVDRRAGAEHLLVSDFGRARGEDQTPQADDLRYLAPEAALGQVGPPGDVYALGCVLHEALTGSAAFSQEDAEAVLEAHRSGPRPRPSEVAPGLAHALDQVMATATAVEPGSRFGSCGELIGAARQALSLQQAPVPATAPFGAAEPLPPEPQAAGPAPPIWGPGDQTPRRIATAREEPDPYQPYERRRMLPWVVAGVSVVGMILLLGLIWASGSPGDGPALGGGIRPGTTHASPRTSPTPSPSRSPSPSPSPSPTPSPQVEGVTVLVLNGTETAGLATEAASLLETAGFTTATPGNAPATELTTIYYRAEYEVDAHYIGDEFFPEARILPGTSEDVTDVQIVVILGQNHLQTSPSG